MKATFHIMGMGFYDIKLDGKTLFHLASPNMDEKEDEKNGLLLVRALEKFCKESKPANRKEGEWCCS